MNNQRLAQENAVIAEIGRIISSTLKIEEVYEKFAQTVKKLIPFDRINITLINPEEEIVTTAYTSGVDVEDLPIGNIVPLTGSFTQEIARTRKSMLMLAENRHQFTDRFPSVLKRYQAGLHSAISVPLCTKDQVIGALHIRSLTPDAYTDMDVVLAEKVGLQIAGAIASAQLFQERKRIAEILRGQEEKYRMLLETMEEGYFEVDLKGNFTFVNDSLCKMHGRQREKMLGMNNREYTDQETARRIYKIFTEVYKTGQPVKLFEWKVIRGDGTRAIQESSVYLIRNAKGEPNGFRGIVRDITGRKQMEAALREREEKYRTLLETMEESYFETDLKGRLTFVNDSLCKMQGLSREKLLGLAGKDFMEQEGVQRVYKMFPEVYKTGQPVKLVEWEIIKGDGTRSVRESSVYLMRNTQGEPIGFRGIERDITERKQAEAEREKLIHELQDALSNIKVLRGMLPICASCKKIRDDKGYWNQIESYIRDRSEAEFSHGICPECKKKLYPEFDNDLLESGS